MKSMEARSLNTFEYLGLSSSWWGLSVYAALSSPGLRSWFEPVGGHGQTISTKKRGPYPLQQAAPGQHRREPITRPIHFPFLALIAVNTKIPKIERDRDSGAGFKFFHLNKTKM